MDQTATNQETDQTAPESDVLGWGNGTWYNETLDVDQSDGVDASEEAAMVNRTMVRVEAIRCVEFTEPVPVSVISCPEFAELQREGNFTAEMTPELRAFDNAKFEALFLVNEPADSIGVQRRNRDVGVLGFYVYVPKRWLGEDVKVVRVSDRGSDDE